MNELEMAALNEIILLLKNANRKLDKLLSGQEETISSDQPDAEQQNRK